jgi:hypothetical protein
MTDDSEKAPWTTERALADMRAGQPGPMETAARQIMAVNPTLADQLGITDTVNEQAFARWAKEAGRPMVTDLRVTLLP